MSRQLEYIYEFTIDKKGINLDVTGELVRCKECKYFISEIEACGCSGSLDFPTPNDFCSRGRRAEPYKEEER